MNAHPKPRFTTNTSPVASSDSDALHSGSGGTGGGASGSGGAAAAASGLDNIFAELTPMRQGGSGARRGPR